MIDRLAALAAAALLSLTTLALHETATVGVADVRRSSLDGFDVGDARGLDLGEAAQALAETAVAALDAAAPAAVKPHADLMRSHRVLGGKVVEVWRAGPAAERRVYALHHSVVQPYVEITRYAPRGFTAAPPTVEIRYPAGHPVPAIEAAAVTSAS